VTDYLGLPAPVRVEAERWLDRLEAMVSAIEDGAARLSESEAAYVHEAVADVRMNTSFARGAFSGARALAELPSPYFPMSAHPSRELALLVHAVGDELGGTPWSMIENAKRTLDDSQRRPFLLVVGTVLASVFTSLTQGVWNDYPELAPQGWRNQD
jgi:hypothetical protein